MSTQNTQRAREAIEDDTFVKALKTVLDYLWDDERQHHEQHSPGDARHVFQSLQVLRKWLSSATDGPQETALASEKTPSGNTESDRGQLRDAGKSARITLLDGDFGTFILEADDGRDVLIQTDWDYPGVASIFGWSPCSCGRTDGTVDCPHRTASEMIAEAGEFLGAHIGDTAEDPGYFEG
jgi:hypothetical protein